MHEDFPEILYQYDFTKINCLQLTLSDLDKYDFEVLSDNMDPLPEFLQDVRVAVSATSVDEATQGFMKFFFE